MKTLQKKPICLVRPRKKGKVLFSRSLCRIFPLPVSRVMVGEFPATLNETLFCFLLACWPWLSQPSVQLHNHDGDEEEVKKTFYSRSLLQLRMAWLFQQRIVRRHLLSVAWQESNEHKPSPSSPSPHLHLSLSSPVFSPPFPKPDDRRRPKKFWHHPGPGSGRGPCYGWELKRICEAHLKQCTMG